MNEMTSEQAVRQLVAVLDEAFEKPSGEWHHFTDASPDSGYFGTIAKLPFAKAGRSVAGTSVAEQVHHVTFVMDTLTAHLSGGSDSPGLEQWQASWHAKAIDEAAWQRLQEQLHAAYARLRHAIQRHSVSDAESFGASVGTLAHVAYHLGAIRQKIALLNEAD